MEKLFKKKKMGVRERLKRVFYYLKVGRRKLKLRKIKEEVIKSCLKRGPETEVSIKDFKLNLNYCIYRWVLNK